MQDNSGDSLMGIVRQRSQTALDEILMEAAHDDDENENENVGVEVNLPPEPKDEGSTTDPSSVSSSSGGGGGGGGGALADVERQLNIISRFVESDDDDDDEKADEKKKKQKMVVSATSIGTGTSTTPRTTAPTKPGAQAVEGIGGTSGGQPEGTPEDPQEEGGGGGVAASNPPELARHSGGQGEEVPPGAYGVTGIAGSTAPAADGEESEIDSGSEGGDIEQEDEDVPEGQDDVEDPNTTQLTDGVSAYVVEESSEQPEQPPTTVATVIKTPFGIIIDGRRMMILGSIMLLLVVVAIVLGSVLGTQSSASTQTSAEGTIVCGPICGSSDIELPMPDKEVFGHSCNIHDFNAQELVNKTSETYCSDTYDSIAYGCGCPSTEVPNQGCGGLCANGQDLPDPNMIVMDINFQEMTCQDWELKSLFDTNPEECPNYNTIGFMCGCQENVPHPDACGPMCTEIDSTNYKTKKEIGKQWLWKQTCDEWNIMATFLPHWYLTSEKETCDEYFKDVAYQCGCLNQAEFPPSSCGTLCQERSTCGLICKDGSPAPNPDLVVRDMTCQGWDFLSKVATEDEEMCRFYEMVGHDCGCNNEPPNNACGPLCGTGNTLPDPQRQVQGQTCAEWEGLSMFLYEGYGLAMGSHDSMIQSCDGVFSQIAYGCGCPNIEPPADACGLLCGDGSPVPDPNLIVGDRTCGNLELTSLFDTDQEKCNNYHTIVASQCGCPETTAQDESTTQSDCITKEDLYNQTFFKTIGMSQYSITFGENGKFVQIQNNKDVNLIGRYRGFGSENGSRENEAGYGGGNGCGMYGPRRGSVVVVEDPEISEPTITKILEPYICVYQAELAVPKMCMMS